MVTEAPTALHPSAGDATDVSDNARALLGLGEGEDRDAATLGRWLAGRVIGPPDRRWRRLASPERAGTEDLCVLLAGPGDGPLPAIAVVGEDHVADAQRHRRPDDALVVVSDPRRALSLLLRRTSPIRRRQGVDEGASVASTAVLGEGVFVGAGARIEPGARIGAGTQIGAQTVVGENVVVGDGCWLHPRVTLYPGTVLGERVEIQAGTVIGSSGFGLCRDDQGRAESIRHAGRVVIEDDVEIGANCVIDRATLDETRIGRRTKIDNLVQIGHNCVLGADCVLAAQVGIAGSVRLGDGCMLMGQVGVTDHVTLAPGTVVGAQGGVVRDLGAGEWLSSPALPARLGRRVVAAWKRLPAVLREIRELRRRVAALEQREP